MRRVKRLWTSMPLGLRRFLVIAPPWVMVGCVSDGAAVALVAGLAVVWASLTAYDDGLAEGIEMGRESGRLLGEVDGYDRGFDAALEQVRSSAMKRLEEKGR